MIAKKKLGISVGIIVLLMIGGLIGYFGYYVKTPTYSLGLIKTSIQKHDWETFSKHVDSDQFISSVFDGFIGYAMDKESDDTVKSFAGGFVTMLKPGVVKEMTNGLKKYVETGDAKSNADSKDTTAAAADNLKKQTNLSDIEYKGISYTKVNDNIAAVGLNIYDKHLAKEFVIELKMRELSDGTWQVIEWSNIKDYLAETEKAKKEKLAELNKPMQEQIDETLSVKSITGTIGSGDAYGFSKKLNVAVKLDAKGDKAISRVQGNIQVQDENHKVLMEKPIDIHLAGAVQKEITKVFVLDLNPFMGNTKKILQSNLNDLKLECKISALEFADGNKIKLLTALPEDQ